MLSVASSTAVPAPDSLAQMLIQSLTAQDHALLEEVLHYKKSVTVEKTLGRLPISHVIPLILAITEKIEAKPSRGGELNIWLRQLFITHRSYLLSSPDVAAQLQPLYKLIDMQLNNYPKLTKLQGKLELLLQEKKSDEEVVAPLSPVSMEEEEEEEDEDIIESEESDAMSD
ncbi:hypothetical protein ACHWQZ_G014114 [Mnemiopsis leidyi]